MATIASLGQEIRQARKRRRLRGGELAAQAGLSRNTLSAFENGHGNVELNSLLALCDALGLDVVVIPNAVSPLVEHDRATRKTAGQLSLDSLMGHSARKPSDSS